jgi:LAS superfamily LD-carboxypeptidase LdcB
MVHSNSAEIEIGELFGLSESHLVPIPETGMMIHARSLAAYTEMQQAAAEQGIEIQVASAYRSFQRQLNIWNAKALGERDCLDDSGNCLDLTRLTDMEAVQAIMRFSALPGASRHHWGTDMDVYDAAAVSADYQLQLVASEYLEGGPFNKLHLWLENNAQEFGFARPYQIDRAGIAPEAWHISHHRVAQRYQSALGLELLAAQLRSAELEMKDTVLNNLQYLFERYIQIT